MGSPSPSNSAPTSAVTKNEAATLANGFELPRIGFGTHQLRDDACKIALRSALQHGYKLIDGASIYKNSVEIGEVFVGENSSSNVLIATKISPYEMGYEKSLAAYERELEALGRVDVLLIHWPGKARKKHADPIHSKLRLETWRALEHLYFDKQMLKAIGVSNYEISHLEEMKTWLEDGKIKSLPHINQVEYHPLCQQKDLLEFCTRNEIALQAYSPLGSAGSDEQPNELLNHTVVKSIANELSRSCAQILLRWGLQSGAACVLPRSSKCAHIGSNIAIFDFVLAEKHMEMFGQLGRDGDKHFCWEASGVQ